MIRFMHLGSALFALFNLHLRWRKTEKWVHQAIVRHNFRVRTHNRHHFVDILSESEHNCQRLLSTIILGFAFADKKYRIAVSGKIIRRFEMHNCVVEMLSLSAEFQAPTGRLREAPGHIRKRPLPSASLLFTCRGENYTHPSLCLTMAVTL